MLGSSIFVPLGIQGSNRTFLVITGILFSLLFFSLLFLVIWHWMKAVRPINSRLKGKSAQSGNARNSKKAHVESNEWNW